MYAFVLETKHIQVEGVKYVMKQFKTDKDVLDYVIEKMKEYDVFESELELEMERELEKELSLFLNKFEEFNELKKNKRVREKRRQLKTVGEVDLIRGYGDGSKRMYQKLEEYRDLGVKSNNDNLFEGDLIDFPIGVGIYLSFYRLSENEEYKWATDFFEETIKHTTVE